MNGVAAIDYDKFPESTWLSLLAASYKLTLELFRDPAIQSEYKVWLVERRAKEQRKELQ